MSPPGSCATIVDLPLIFTFACKYEYYGKKQRILPLTIDQIHVLLSKVSELKENGNKVNHNKFKELFAKYDIQYEKGNLKEEILKQTEKEFYSTLVYLLGLVLQMRNSVTNSSIDYLISPVRNKEGRFYHSDFAKECEPNDADANGAYHIALKGLWAVEQIQQSDDVKNAKIAISNKEWLEYAQSRFE